jgi:(p)ppGpp synthase/HD superfamily hydrolase
MFTLQQAIDLAIKAHKGQWRRSKPSTKEYLLKDYTNFGVEGFFINTEGNKISYTSEEGWIEQEPYISHPLAVMNIMTAEEEKIIAVLHDVIEDTEWELSEIISDEGNFYSILYQPATDNGVFEQECYDISKDIYKALDVLTKMPNQSYIEYLTRLSQDKLAIKVKLADIFHNMSDNPSEHAKQKYLKAIPILLQNI